MSLLPPEITEIVLSNYWLIIACLVGYTLAFVLISYAAKRQLADEVSDYVVASRNLGWLVVTFTMYASVLSGVGMAGIPGTAYTVGVPFVVTVLMGHTIALVLLWYFGPRIWILGKEYRYTTPGDLLGDYYQSDTIRIYTVIASVIYNVAYIVAQLLAGGILLNVLSGSVISVEWGVLIIAVVVMLHVVSAGLRGIAWLDSFNGVLIMFLLALFGFAFGVFFLSEDTKHCCWRALVEMVSENFEGQNRVARQRLVYKVLDEDLKGPVHALSLKLNAPNEV